MWKNSSEQTTPAKARASIAVGCGDNSREYIKFGAVPQDSSEIHSKVKFTPADELALGHMKYAQGLGASLRYANELRSVQQIGRLPPLRSSHLHEDVLRGTLGAGGSLVMQRTDQSMFEDM